MGLIANQPSSIAKILDASFKLYSASFKKIIGFSSIIAIIYLILSLVSNQMTPDDLNPEKITDGHMEILLVLMGVSILAMFLSLIFYAAIVYRIDNLACGRNDSFGEALLFGLKKFPAMALAIIFYFLAVFMGMILLVIPGLILWLSLAFYFFFIILEHRSAYAALKASHRLVWGDWWRTMVVFIVPMFLMGIVYSLLIMFVVYFEGLGDIYLILFELAYHSILALILPYLYTIAYVQYRDLKLRKSGTDLEARMT